MIGLSQRSESEDFQAGQPGAMTVSTISAMLFPFSVQLKAVIARAGTAGTTGTSNTDIRKNGVSIFASGASAIQFASGSSTPSYGTLAAPTVTFAKGDVLTIVNTAIHTTAIQNLAIALLFCRLHGGRLPASVLFDTFGTDNER